MTTNELTKVLRDSADRIDKAQKNYLISREDIGIAEAMAKLRASFPDGLVSVQVKTSCYSSGSEQVEWTAYNGSTHFRSQTLFGAMQAALASLQPDQTVQEAIAAVEAATEPEPMAF